MDNLKEMDRFLEKLNLSRLNWEEKEIMNNPITSNKIDKPLARLIKKKKRRIKSTKLEMKRERLLWTSVQ